MKSKTDGFDLNSFAERLRALRKERGFSQVELSSLAGLSSVHLSRYERAGTSPSIDALKRMAKALDCSVEYLIEGSVDVGKADPEMGKRLQAIEHLPPEDKESVKKLLDAFLLRQKIQDLRAV